jgi:hypothetical protein
MLDLTQAVNETGFRVSYDALARPFTGVFAVGGIRPDLQVGLLERILLVCRIFTLGRPHMAGGPGGRCDRFVLPFKPRAEARG